MNKSKRIQHPKHQSSKGRKTKNYRAFFKRHLATLDLIATSLTAIIFIPLAALYVIAVFSSYSRAEEVASSAAAQVTPVVSAAPVQAPILPSTEQGQQLTPPQTNNIPPDVSNNATPIANVSDLAKPVDADSKRDIVSHTPDFIEEQTMANHPFDSASAVSQAQAVGQPSLGSVSPTDFGFTGQRQENFGLIDYGGRFYDPVLGRFISPDPIIPDYTNPQALNRYSYVYNNPVRYNDPTGHCPLCVAVIAGTIVTLDAVDVGSSLYITSNPSQFSAEDVDYAQTSLGLWQAGMMADGPMVAGDAFAAAQGAWRGGKSLWRWGSRAFAQEAADVGTHLIDDVARQASHISPYQVHIDPLTGKGPMGIDTSAFSSGIATANGGIRNRSAFWQEWAKKYPGTLSADNLDLINEVGLSPQVDDVWLEHFPEHAPYAGEILEHHHLDQGPIAIPLPETVHRKIPGFGIWHSQ